MEESLERKGLVRRHRKAIASSIILFVTLVMIANSPVVIDQLIEVVAPSHTMYIWISPIEEEVNLNVEIYNSEDNVGDPESRFHNYGFRVEPSDQEQRIGLQCQIPWNAASTVVKVYFDEFSESHYFIQTISIGETVTNTLLDIEIRIFIEP